MAEKLTFVGLEFDGYHKKRKGLVTVADVRCDLSGPILEKMEWKEAPECYTGGGLEGDVAAAELDVIPSDRTLVGHAINLKGIRLHHFRTVRLEAKESRGKGHRTELRFKVTTGDPEAGTKLEQFFSTAVAKSQLKVTWEKQPKQEGLALDVEKSSGCVQCDANIELDPTNPKKHVSGQKCTAKAKPPKQEELPN